MIVDIYDTDKKYKVIYCDPPWQFNNKKTGGSMTSGSDYQYKSVMSIEDLKKMPIQGITDNEGCILFMWWVGAMPKEAIDLVESWGFKLKNMNGFVWNKLTKKGLPFFGMGFYTRAGSESCIVATKGKVKIKNRGVRAVWTDVVREHSRKPDKFYELIDLISGDVPKIELFARNEREGWDCFGNEIKAQ